MTRNPSETRTALEQSFADLCDRHDLTSVSVHYTPRFDSFLCYAHAGAGICTDGRGETIAEAVGAAITEINGKRGRCPAIPLADEALPLGEEA